MPRACSADLRRRVIAGVEGGASRREGAEQFEVSVSVAARWLHCWQVSGRSEAKPRGGSKSGLEEHKEWLLAVIAEQPDLTLDEVVVAELGWHPRLHGLQRCACPRLMRRAPP